MREPSSRIILVTGATDNENGGAWPREQSRAKLKASSSQTLDLGCAIGFDRAIVLK